MIEMKNSILKESLTYSDELEVFPIPKTNFLHKFIGNPPSSKYKKQNMWKNLFYIITLWARYSGALRYVIIISLFALKEFILLSSWNEFE